MSKNKIDWRRDAIIGSQDPKGRAIRLGKHKDNWVSLSCTREVREYCRRVRNMYQAVEGQPVSMNATVMTALQLLDNVLQHKGNERR